MTTNTLNLYCDDILARPIDTFWGEFNQDTDEPRFRVVCPDFDAMEAAELFDYADDYGVTLESDPRELPRHELVGGLESIGTACYDDESDELLAQAYGDSMLAGDLGDISADDWTDALREAFEEQEQPAMNYRYPVTLRGVGENEAAAALVGLPLCLVWDDSDEEHYLALTGGGMDLSAEICRAYIALKQRPPVHFCRVPRMAGRKYSAEFLTTLIESCEVAQNWAQSTIDDLRAIQADADYSEAAA